MSTVYDGSQTIRTVLSALLSKLSGRNLKV